MKRGASGYCGHAGESGGVYHSLTHGLRAYGDWTKPNSVTVFAEIAPYSMGYDTVCGAIRANIPHCPKSSSYSCIRTSRVFRQKSLVRAKAKTHSRP